MSCIILDTGIAKQCRASIGGVKRFLIAELDAVTSVTTASGVATAITKSGLFYEFIPTKKSSSASSPFSGSVEAGQRSWNHTVVMQFAKSEAAKRNVVAVLAETTIVAIVEDKNGKYHLYGWDLGLELTEGDNTIGVAPTDMNGYTLTFSEEHSAPPLEVDSSIIAGLLTA
jgi:hypothetical protein